jgi:alkylhydroperoxidase/carboxymuconolactone decarboxylase family protein YurZ
MKKVRYLSILAIFTFQPAIDDNIHAQNDMNQDQTLDSREQTIVAISAFTAKGNMTALTKALNEGLDAGLSISEIKEMLVQLYAYTGFPRSLNALNNFMEVVKERKQKGIKDEPGKEPDPLPGDKTKLQQGTEIQTRLVGQPVKGVVYEFAPVIDQFLKEHLFCDIFGRNNLDFKTREIVTISALAALGGVEAQLSAHFSVGLHNGLTADQLNQIVSIIQNNVDAKEGVAAWKVLQTVLRQ